MSGTTPTLRMLIGTLLLLLFLSVAPFLSGTFLTKRILRNKTPPAPPKQGKQVIMLLVDALREDFVEMDEGLLKGSYSSRRL
jgi:phosphatidylinositol glycan class O